MTGLPICGGSERVVQFGVGCGQPIVSIDDLYRCATCSIPMHVDCLRRHFGPGDGPPPTRVEQVAMELRELDRDAPSTGASRRANRPT